MKTLINKIALITGASRGIGKAIALRYAQFFAGKLSSYVSGQHLLVSGGALA